MGNKTKILSNFGIKKYNPIKIRSADFVIINKREKYKLIYFTFPEDDCV